MMNLIWCAWLILFSWFGWLFHAGVFWLILCWLRELEPEQLSELVQVQCFKFVFYQSTKREVPNWSVEQVPFFPNHIFIGWYLIQRWAMVDWRWVPTLLCRSGSILALGCWVPTFAIERQNLWMLWHWATTRHMALLSVIFILQVWSILALGRRAPESVVEHNFL